MPQQSPDFSPHDIISIKEWIEKEPHLPKDLSDVMIKKFLHSCYGSLERTKKCIERFCTTRSAMTEVYTNRDPCSKQMKTAFDITDETNSVKNCQTGLNWITRRSVVTYEAGEIEILIHQLDDPTLERFDYYSLLKSFSLQADYWLNDREYYPQGHVLILDIKDYTLRMLPKVNIMFFRDFLLFLLEGMPVRVKSVHIVNYPPYYEKLFALVKPVLPAYIINVINFHQNYASLHKAVGKQYLPVEYEGDAPEGMRQQHLKWVKKIQEIRDVYLNDDMWKADIKKKPKTVESAMNGSFKTLSID